MSAKEQRFGLRFWVDFLVYAGLAFLVLVLAGSLRRVSGDNQALKAQVSRLQERIPRSTERLSAKKLGEQFPRIALPNLTSEEMVELGPTSTSGRWSLYIFFGITSCACVEEIPFWNSLATDYVDRLNVTGILVGESRARLLAFAEVNHIEIALVHDRDGSVLEQRKVQDVSEVLLPPFLFLLNADGNIIHVGGTTRGDAARRASYRQLLDRLLPHL